MPLWKENFDFYEARAERGRAFVSVDLAASEHAPVASHPVRLQLRVKMKAPREDGLRSEEEAEALFALEDRLVETLREKCDAIYVARAVAYGHSEFFFYVPARYLEKTPPLPDAGGYGIEFLTEHDADWDRYTQLYPDSFSLQTMFNRRLLAQLEKAGDDFEIPRVVDHFAYFETKAQAQRAAAALEKADFDVDDVTEPKEDGAPWGLQFHRDESLAEGADEFVLEVLELIEPHEGAYDGWGCSVQKKQDLN